MPFMRQRGLIVRILAISILAAGALCQRTSYAAGEPPAKILHVLILTGDGNPAWRSTTPFLRRLLEGTGRFDVRICETPAGVTAKALAGIDVLVDDCAGAGWDADAQKAIADFVSAGKGLVITHAALGSVQADLPAMAKSLPVAKAPGVGATDFIEIKLDKPDHAIVKGISGSFKLADSVHQGLTPPAGAEVLATFGGSPVLFTMSLGKGRIFCSDIGHDLAAMQATEFITTFARGIEWTAGADVTLVGNVTLPQPKADAVRALLVTGGHEHETSFYATFDGYNDVAWVQVASPALAFAKDFRDKFDVLILYDFTREPDEATKKNLRDFVESGKGVVVLHHALLDYQTWTWWYQEVVGGSYRLAPGDKVPASTVKASQQMFITPLKHPITAGIEPFTITDETYKRMWISPDVQPILATDNPASDSTIGWISAYPKSKVVYLQLGHGRGAFFHPSFRALVHNAILWTAGRLK